jgi:hypothetical protein
MNALRNITQLLILARIEFKDKAPINIVLNELK